MKAAPAARRRWSVRVGAVAGIDIRLHATLLVLAWLVVIGADDESSDFLAPLVWLVLLFGSVLVHELAHALTARRLGVGVVEIELLPIGGVSRMERIPDRPADEVAIAVAGPLTSLAIGIAALTAAAVLDGAVWPPDLYDGAIALRLGWLNVLLAAFNLLPALPLDGGRVLRAAVETRLGPTQATHVAARAGRYFAFGLIAVGVVWNVWLMVIGTFVYLASRAEDAGATIHAELGTMTAADVMVRGAMALPAAMPLSALDRVTHTTMQRQFAVVGPDGGYLGMADLDGDVPPGAIVVDDITEPVPPVAPTAPLDEVALTSRPRALAVVEQGAVIGLVRADDVARVVNRTLKKERTA